MIRVLVNGALGKMGEETVKAVQNAPELELVGTANHNDDLDSKIATTKAQVVIDFTTPAAVYNNALTIIEANAHPVIGTTGLTEKQIHELQERAAEKRLGGVIAPNFSIGAVLMMYYAREIARYYNAAEIIELHHDRKKDAPSGTALKTAAMMAENLIPITNEQTDHASMPGARGTISHGIPIHSVRLPGLVAHQEIIFGGKGETLTIRHDSIHREAFMPGVILACKKVMELDRLVYGLEEILL